MSRFDKCTLFYLHHYTVSIKNIHNQCPEAHDLYSKQKKTLQCNINLCYILSFFRSLVAHHSDDFQDQLVTDQNVNHVHQTILVQQDKYAALTGVFEDSLVTWNKFS